MAKWDEYGRSGLWALGWHGRQYVKEDVSWDKHVARYLLNLCEGWTID